MAEDNYNEEEIIQESEEIAPEELQDDVVDVGSEPTGKFLKLIKDGDNKYRIAGMFKNYFLDYASYVILDRAVPSIYDGLKPVQRRILHAMRTTHNGALTKVAAIVGETMKYHTHGDASIKDALVQMGQKDLLIVRQGNWGNSVTGDEAAAGRYIEAKLSPFALEVVFNSKITEWMQSYDGRNKEPVTLPIKFPLVLQQGAEGIAVGLNCKILPHNFNELIDASISYLKGETFQLYPDFPSGGIMDVNRYNDGKRGGVIKVRAKIIKKDKKTLEIIELPFGKTADDIKESIVAASEKNKIKIKKIEDFSKKSARIAITLHNDVSPDKTIDALYAFTDCEISISPNTCVIMDNKPHFLTVTEVLKYSTERTKELLKKELEINLQELEESWHYLSLEKIFFEQKKYKILEKDAKNWEQQVEEIHKAMKAYEKQLKAPVTLDDINKLVEKPVRKISKFDVKECEAKIAKIEDEIAAIQKNIANITKYTIDYFKSLKKRYGEQYPRRTEVANLENIQATKVVAINAKLYANYEEGFVGMNLKKDENAQFVANCSDIDDIIVFLKDGRYIVTKITDKAFIGKDIIHIGIFVKNNNRTIYNVAYRDGKNGNCFVKRFAVTGVTKNKEYNLTMGTPDSKVLYFTANQNGEGEVVRVHLRPRPKLKKLTFLYDFSTLTVKGRSSRGNILTKNAVSRIELKSKGSSTIGDKPIWFDRDINRLNEDRRGEYLGKFKDDDSILVVYKDGTYCTTSYDLSNHYQGDILSIGKFYPEKIYSAIYYDTESQKYYLKRFKFEKNNNLKNNFISEAESSYLVAITDKSGSQIVIQFAGKHKDRANELVITDEFIAEKSWKAKGKRLTAYEVDKVVLIEPPTLEDDEEEYMAGDVVEFDIEEADNTEYQENDNTPEPADNSEATPEDDEDFEDFPEDDEPTLF